jgi:putative restriction endonuclease
MRNSEIEKLFSSINVWKRGDVRAPHKPLLLLMALASVQRGEQRLTAYANIETKLRDLLRDYGPSRKSYHPEYPFWRLQNDDGIWEIPERGEIIARDTSKSDNVPAGALRKTNAKGGFPEKLYQSLRNDTVRVEDLAGAILEEHFPVSLHESLLDAVGFPWVTEVRTRTKRSAAFRDDMLRLYQHRCAFCGFDGRIGSADLSLEAAHIKWHAFGGPDAPHNGLLLCSIHHQALDRGAIGLSNDRRLLVSQHLHGGLLVEDFVIKLAGKEIAPPLEPSALPDETFIRWHQKEVFRTPARVN